MTKSWSQSEFDQRLKAHETWLATGGATGQLLALTGITLADVKMVEARLDGVDCSEVALYRCDLSRVQMNGCRFAKSALYDCCLDGAELVDAVFHGATLQGVSAHHANLRGTFWHHANLRQVDLTSVFLDGAQFEACQFDRVRWPATMPAHLSKIVTCDDNR